MNVAAVETNIVSILVIKHTLMTIFPFAMHSGLEVLWLELRFSQFLLVATMFTKKKEKLNVQIKNKCLK